MRAVGARRPVRARRAVLRRQGHRAARAAAGRARGGDLRRRARRPGARAHPRPARPRAAPDRHPARAARRGAARGARRRAGHGARPPGPGAAGDRARRAAARHPRADHDPRPCRGRRAVRRGAAARRVRLDRADRLSGQVGAVPAQARRRGRPRRRRRSPGSGRRSGCPTSAARSRRRSRSASPRTCCAPSSASDQAPTGGAGARRHDALPRPGPRHARRPVPRRRAARRAGRRACSSPRRRDRRPRPVRRGARPAPGRADVCELTDGLLLPGFVDTHVHFPQARIIGALGMPLLDWLDRCALPEEARLADLGYAPDGRRASSSPGWPTPARPPRWSSAPTSRRRSTRCSRPPRRRAGCGSPAGWWSSDRLLRRELHTTAAACLRRGAGARRPMARRRAQPLRGHPSVLAVVHRRAARLLRGAPRGGRRQLVHLARQREPGRDRHRARPVRRAATSTATTGTAWSGRGACSRTTSTPPTPSWSAWPRGGAAVAHCPTSNAALGSGLFPLDRHLAHGVPVALGSDVGAGTGYSLFKEGLQAYFMQQLRGADGVPLTVDPSALPGHGGRRGGARAGGPGRRPRRRQAVRRALAAPAAGQPAGRRRCATRTVRSRRWRGRSRSASAPMWPGVWVDGVRVKPDGIT